jgi:hypothetical protein
MLESNVATSWKTDAASRIGDVLIVADYDGIEGTLFDTVGAIYDNLSGDALNVTARHGVFSAEGAWKNSGHGVGASGNPLHTKINTIAAVTDNGDIAIRNYGDLTVGSVGIQLQGVMSDLPVPEPTPPRDATCPPALSPTSNPGSPPRPTRLTLSAELHCRKGR